MLASCVFAHAAQAARVQECMHKHVTESHAARDDTRMQRHADLRGHKRGLWRSFKREPQRACGSLQHALARRQINTANVMCCVWRLRALAQIVAIADAMHALEEAHTNEFYRLLSEYESARVDDILHHLARQYRKLCHEELIFADSALTEFLHEHCGVAVLNAGGWIHQD